MFGAAADRTISQLYDNARLNSGNIVIGNSVLQGGKRIDVGSGRGAKGGAEVWLVRYDPREQDVAVKSGDNKGQTLVQKNVVREVKKLGLWKGRPAAFKLPAASEDGLKTVVLVQQAHGGRILGVAQLKSK